MSLVWDYDTGHLSDMLPSLHRRLGRLANGCTEYKIGLTVDPDTRWAAHKRNGWERMVVVYHTSSEKYITGAESHLIGYGQERIYYKAECQNLRGGGGGIRRGYYDYYLYIVLY